MASEVREWRQSPWGEVDGQAVSLYQVRNAQGTRLVVTNYGAIITELQLPDRSGSTADVVLGFEDLAGYVDGHPYFGCIVGRCANRIANAEFELDGRRYPLASNNGANHLHGGERGFDKYVWQARVHSEPDHSTIEFYRESPAGEEGYPGRLRAWVEYTLTNDNELWISMRAVTDAATVVNLAHHTYWNLAGHDSGSVEDHLVQMHAEQFTPVNDALIPTGEFAAVAGTPFDLRAPTRLGDRLGAIGGGALPHGFDHNFVIDGEPSEFRPVCTVREPASGRGFELWSDQPGCQLYTGNFLDGTETGKGSTVYEQHQGFCVETQFHPDSIHQPQWPTPILRPGEEYRHRMRFHFKVK